MAGGYSAFDDEDEILIQDGLKYQVIDIKEEQTDDSPNKPEKYLLIQLQYPPSKKNRIKNWTCENVCSFSSQIFFK